ncbi:50S ribosomal protein L35 [candidate division WWE3 bacterium]|uniref:Large ribosomal subunit protein bL35 n=1 Tax=candidate division WWE3 bacterium TaxID=2053526 RepID=A0A955LH05_UNCKA|nr:50S ribosomal protein L35 [candidate division WWE3 bacterium]
MPKMKTNKSIKKRFHITKNGKGKIMVGEIGIRHGRTKLRRKTIRRKLGLSEVTQATAAKVRKFLPYGGRK